MRNFMKGFVLLALCFLIVSGCVSVPSVSVPTPSVNIRVTIVNNTGADIIEVGMFPRGSSNPAEIHLFIGTEDPPLLNGENRIFNIPQVNNYIMYNIISVTRNEDLFRKVDVSITHGMVITFTQSDFVRNVRQPQTTSNITTNNTNNDNYNTPSVSAAYKVGDIGPAGGIIFYDKGNNSQGWRYLEAAPFEAETRAVWSVRDTNVENTQEGIGSGRRNTQLIADAFSRASGEWDTAAQYCDDLVIGGYDDWFLPSTGELDQMYGNLKRRNMGDFRNEWYWSSTQHIWASCQNFSNGSLEDHPKQRRYYVRPIRQVAGSN